MTRWLVTGAGGMLGRDLVTLLRRRDAPVTGLTHRDLDVTDAAALRGALPRHRPDVLVNCASWTAVDDAESHEDDALEINGRAVAHLAASCVAEGIRLVHLSTDYVFDGSATRPYAEDHTPAPCTAYGRTKLAGELAVLNYAGSLGYVVRTAWLYGAHGPNFVRTMVRLEHERPSVDVVDDQLGQPTWTADVAEQIFTLVQSGAPAGVYHATSSGETTWFGFAQEIFRLLGADPGRVRPTTSTVLARPAQRPAYSVLGHDAWAREGIEPIGHWQVALRRAFSEICQAEGSDLAASG